MTKIFQQKGVILIIAVLTLGTLLLLGSYFLSFTITESKISKSQEVATQAYYLAEAGINEAIWKLKNDDTAEDGDDVWKDEFVATSTNPDPEGNYWSDTFVRNYTQNSTTTVSIQNFKRAGGEIITISTVGFAKGKTAQRVVKTKVLRALGSLTEDSPIFAGSPSGESAIKNSIMNVYNGNMFVNNNLNIKKQSTVNVYDNPATTDIQEGKVLVAGNCIGAEKINASSICCADICNTTSTCECTDITKFENCEVNSCPPISVDMPPVDFDSYYSKAEQAELYGLCSVSGKKFGQATITLSTKCVFTEKEFEDLLQEVGWWGTLILEHRTNGFAISTYYVEGGITVGGGRHLEINGVLVTDKTVNIGKWSDGHLAISDPGQGIPSGLLTRKKMNFGGWFLVYKEVDVEGLLYSLEEMSLDSIIHTFNVKGGMIARKFFFDGGWWNPLNIYLDNDIIREGIWGGSEPPSEEPSVYSPIVTIEHWEEAY